MQVGNLYLSVMSILNIHSPSLDHITIHPLIQVFILHAFAPIHGAGSIACYGYRWWWYNSSY